MDLEIFKELLKEEKIDYVGYCNRDKIQ